MTGVAVITGAGSGIGRATAAAMSSEGWRVALAGRRVEPLHETGALLSGDWLAAATDVADPGSCATLIERCITRFGRIDALVNNAAEAPLLPIEETDAGTLRRVFDINALGTGYLTLAAWPHMVRQGGGRIVNVSTIGTSSPFPGFFAYAASKGAVEVMVKSCEIEGRAHNIRAFGVAPGAVETRMLRAIFTEGVIPSSKCLRPEDVARVVVDCASGRRDAENGTTIRMPGP